MMNGSKLLIPAVMLTASLGASATPATAPAANEMTRADTLRFITPAVMGTRALINLFYGGRRVSKLSIGGRQS